MVREEASTAERLAALQGILREQLDWPVRFEQQRLEREVLIVTGHTRPERDRNIRVFAHPDSEHEIYSTGGSVSTLLEPMGDRLNLHVIDRTDEGSQVVRLQFFEDANVPRDHPEREQRIAEVLENVAEQTELEFAVESREVDTWVVTLEP